MLTKKPNSSKSLAPTGIEIKVIAKGNIYAKTRVEINGLKYTYAPTDKRKSTCGMIGINTLHNYI